ncbi:hypothetical protein K504DRAFT_391828 [Pleomassaria siparia CBS 279.74]|uniref:Tautomerase cis-CaaD-like domain-containing protein n=1 Tax=Pleomassaria siparia CBS 279.74 TaxID=1314801 RepID=A0A6G1JTJ0_9PLEO|nr:hypothetical protein K504DRAFT_391828 [Pleomassaria siparia CBS 279.74]
MPLYEIHHSAHLVPHQQTAIAQAFTELHCSTFSAPSSFVNIVFHPYATTTTTTTTTTTAEASLGRAIYVGGVKQATNYIIGHLRPRANSVEALNGIVREMTRIWNRVVRSSSSSSSSTAAAAAAAASGRLDDPLGLHNVFLMEDIAAGAEQGFILPVAGKDGEWAAENMGEFERRAEDGDESMSMLVEECRKTGLGKAKL